VGPLVHRALLSQSIVVGVFGFHVCFGVKEQMEKRTYCVYNQTRECFLSLNVRAADTVVSRLTGFIGRLRLAADEGIWVVPSRGVHTLGLLFPLDLIYLDENYRVIHLIEYFPSFRIGPLKIRAESVLELATHTIYSSHTQTGDQLVICVAEEMQQQLGISEVSVSAGITPRNDRGKPS
jgi:uncharacterized membrane protein (UPF0127 family)